MQDDISRIRKKIRSMSYFKMIKGFFAWILIETTKIWEFDKNLFSFIDQRFLSFEVNFFETLINAEYVNGQKIIVSNQIMRQETNN
jgi:hypothetical protein